MISVKNADMKKFDFLDKMHALTPLKNGHFLAFVKTSIFWSKNHSFLSTISKTIFSDMISVKNADIKKFDFLDKMHGLTSLKNVHFLAFLTTSIFWSKNYSFLSTISKTIFSDMILLKNADMKKFDFWTKCMD